MAVVEDKLEAMVKAGVPGAVVVAVSPGGSVEAASGVADVATGEPLTAGHRFRIGSVTKVFVAALVLRLVEDGLLDLDDEAAPFVEGVTIRQLLNHTSGLDDFDVGPSFWAPYRRNLSHRWPLGPRDELRLVLQKPRLFAPGEGWAYHGSNYIVLRLMIEEATDATLRDSLRDRLFVPLGLKQTDLVEGPLLGECAHGYLAAENPILPALDPVDVTEIDVPFHRAGGGIVSTASDVARMLRAELSGELFSERIRWQLLDAVDSDWPETDRYGLGIGEMTALMGRKLSTCGAAWGHLGFSVGYVSFALSSSDGERQVVICANGHPPEAAEEQFLDAAGELAWHLFCN